MKKFKEGALWVVFWSSEIAIIAPAKKQKKELSEYEIKEREKTVFSWELSRKR